MRLTRRLTLVLLLLIVATAVVTTATACGGEMPTPTPASTLPPTAVPPTATLPPTATPAPTATTVPTVVPASVSGRVLWGGQPVPSARVELRAPDWRVTGDETAIAQVTAGAAGQFLLAAVPPGDYSVVAVWPDGTPSEGGTPALVLEPGQSIADMTLKLEQALTLNEPELSGPVATLPTVSWEPVDGADSYRVWIIDKGTTALVVDAAVAGNLLDVVEQLETSRDYTLVVSAFGAAEDALASVTGDFVTADTPTPPRAVRLPSVCVQPGLPTFLDARAGYCFAYPQDHFLTGDALQPTFAGPPVGSGSAYFPNLTLAGYPLEGREFAAWIDDFVAGFGETAESFERVATTIAGAPAEILEPVPGPTSARQVLVADGPDVAFLSFAPTFRDVPAGEQDFLQRRAQIAVDSLFETVVATLAFLPGPDEQSIPTFELPASCDVDGMGMVVTREVGTTDDAEGPVVAPLCFAIPPGFTAQRTPGGLPRLIGPALDASLSPVRATFALEPPVDAAGQTLDAVVDAFLSANGGDDTVTSDLTVGGETAVLLDNLPGGRGAQVVLLLHDGQHYQFTFTPDPDQVPDAEADMARLMEAVLGSFSFLEE